MTTDITLVVLVHSETLVCGPTMDSAEVAIAAARAAGRTVEPILALDRPTAATTAYFDQPDFDHWDHRVVDEGDLGPARNAIVPQTTGRLVALLDADDLISENWLAEGADLLDAAAEQGSRVIAHPELNVIFDAGAQVNHNLGQDSPLFTPHFLYVRNCYDALCYAPREAFLEVPYGRRDIRTGIAREDWQFALETMSRGWRHVVVPDTIIFKRRREGSLMMESGRRGALVRSLPEMRIDRVRDITHP